MNHVIQIWKLKNLDTVDKNTVKTRIIRLLEEADKLGKCTRDMKKPEFIATQQAKYDVVFDIAATPIKSPVPSTHQSKNQVDSSDEKAKQKRLFIRSCIMPGCNYSASNGLLRWTTKEYLKKKWEKICGLENVSENAKICISHFHPDHIMKKNRRLRMGAVPTRNLPKLKVKTYFINIFRSTKMNHFLSIEWALKNQRVLKLSTFM